MEYSLLLDSHFLKYFYNLTLSKGVGIRYIERIIDLNFDINYN